MLAFLFIYMILILFFVRILLILPILVLVNFSSIRNFQHNAVEHFNQIYIYH